LQSIFDFLSGRELAMPDIPENQLTLVFPQLPDFPITRANTTLIIVDMQKLDAHPQYGIGARAREAGVGAIFDSYWTAVERAVVNQQRLLTAARAAGIPVIYTRIATKTRTARDVGRQHANVNLAVPKDSVDAEILEEIGPGPDDIVISKTSSSPFNSTGIDHTLRSLGAETLLICGVVTNGCVEGTVRDASDLGYAVIMIPDACAAVSPELHQAAITNLDNAFCRCRDTADIVQELEKLLEPQSTAV
jgi:nicotinamidase-related amidase